MKIVSVVGIRQAGKTSTVTALIEEIRRRGQTVGTCKSVFCPTFSMDKPGSNTARHTMAGAQLVCARGKRETAYLYPGPQKLSQVLRAFDGMDYVLLEGDYLSPVPRLVAAHRETDALERTNALTDASALLDYLDAQVPDTAPSPALDEALPPVPGVTDDGFCQCGCHHAQKEQERFRAMAGGRELRLTPERRKILLQWAEEDAHGG